jgi:putative ABC transport system permease protein
MPDWTDRLEARLVALGVPATRRIDIITELGQHLDEARRARLTDREIDRLIRELADIERPVNLEPPVLGKGRASMISSLRQDLSYAVRTLVRSPAYALIVVVTLALGIGANAAIFSVADAVMLRPYSYPDIDRIIAINERTRRGDEMSVAWPTFQDWQASNRSFEQFGIYRSTTLNLTGGDQPERLPAAVASSAVFGVMGIRPSLGRVFGADDDKPGAARTAVISERLWRSRFNVDPAILGRTLVLNGEPHVVIGVMPAGMRFPSRLTEVWLPLGPVIPTLPTSRGMHPGLFVVGKLKPGVSFESAAADMDAIARRLEQAYPESNRDVAVAMIPYYEQIVQSIRPTLYVLLGAVGFVLLIGCANLANLMLARAEARQREIAVRAALGAERRRIIQQLLTESLVLAVTGGALGVVLATWAVKLFVASRPATIPRIDLVTVDLRVIAFAAMLSILTGIVFGLVPALKTSRSDLLSSLKQTARGSGLAPSRRFRSALVIVQVALALVLLVGAGLMIRSFARMMAIEPGFDPEGVVTMRITLPPAKYRELDRWMAFHDELVRRFSSIPGVNAAGINSSIPLEGGGAESNLVVEGRPLPPPGGPGTPCLFQASSAGYFNAMGVALVRGRTFTAQDSNAAPRVAIVDETLVRRLFPDEEPLGKRIAFEFGGTRTNPTFVWREIIGIVRHVRHYGLVSEPPYVQVYVPFDQLPIYFEQRRPAMALVARTGMSAEALTAAVRTELAAIDRDIPVYGVQTMQTYLAQSTEQPRLSVLVLGGLGALALVLAVIGIYGVVSYSVAQRIHEIGVRMALGATRSDVLRMVAGQAVALIAAGVAIGAAVSLALGAVMETLLFEISARDPATLVSIAAILGGVGFVASLVPAGRATRVDPLVALRTE